jgi:hypothetical protein
MKIKRFLPLALTLGALSCAGSASAQYYEIANQIPQLLRPALSGSSSYKGFIEAGYDKTFGTYDADFFEFTTSQGFQYNSWFYMGVGLGVDVLFAHKEDNWGTGWSRGGDSFDFDHSSTSTAAMMPLFTDFRATFGGGGGASFFIDLRLGCSFLLGKDYVEIGNGYLTSQQYFYLRPSIGVKIPVSRNHPRQAVDIGVNYKLLTSNYWNSWNRNVTLNCLGASIAFEW